MEKSNTNYTIRLPKELREQLEFIAEKDSRSLSSLIMKYIKQGVDNDTKASR